MRQLKLLNDLIDGKRTEYNEPSAAFVFVVGAPRSGTTLLTQILACECGYITNIAARFWKNPAMGIAVSGDVLGQNVLPSVESFYGRTRGANDIHEMGYFWRDRLRIEGQSDTMNIDTSRVKWDALQKDLFAISHSFPGAKFVVMKGIYPSYIHSRMQSLLKGKIIWLHIKRPFLQNCAAITRASVKTGRNPFGWPPAVKELKAGEKGIAQQVNWWQQHCESFAHKTIALEDLCNRPRLALEILGLPVHRPPNRLHYNYYASHSYKEFIGLEGE